MAGAIRALSNKTMSMTYFKYFFLVLLLLVIWGCPDKDLEFDSTVYFVNNSDKTLLEYSRDYCYPDTVIPVGGNVFEGWGKKFAIHPRSIRKKKVSWRYGLTHEPTTSVMTIFLFDMAVVDSVPWEKICEDYLVAKRYEYTLGQLDSLNWTITYP